MEVKKPDSKTILRRRQLERCLQLSHSSNPSDRIQAARNIHIYFAEFRELEEKVIDTIYDLCEDQSLPVRLEGYRAVSRISKADNRFLKRNTDVLLQLLQSDDPSEVEVVKEALFDHITMGPRVTFGVLCDQLPPLAAEADEEERNTRVQLRALVLDFLEKQVIPRCTKSGIGSATESALFDCFCELVPQLDVDLVQRIVRNVILKLPNYGSLSSSQGERLVKLLVQRAESEALKTSEPSIISSHPFVETAQNLIINHRAPSLPLLQYYSNSLVDENFLRSLPSPQQLTAIRNIANLLDFCDRSITSSPEVGQHRHKILNATPFLMEALLSAGFVASSLSAFISLLRNCHQWKTREHWTAPPSLITAISQLQGVLGALPPTAEKRELRKMITLVLPSSFPGVASTNTQMPATNGRPTALFQNVRQTGPRDSSEPPYSADRHQVFTLAHRPSAEKRKQSSDITNGHARQSLLHRLQPSEPTPDQGALGFSIKGAASLPTYGNVGKEHSDLLKDMKAQGDTSFSLLARLTDSPLPVSTSNSTTPEHGRRKKKRRHDLNH